MKVAERCSNRKMRREPCLARYFQNTRYYCPSWTVKGLILFRLHNVLWAIVCTYGEGQNIFSLENILDK